MSREQQELNKQKKDPYYKLKRFNYNLKNVSKENFTIDDFKELINKGNDIRDINFVNITTTFITNDLIKFLEKEGFKELESNWKEFRINNKWTANLKLVINIDMFLFVEPSKTLLRFIISKENEKHWKDAKFKMLFEREGVY